MNKRRPMLLQSCSTVVSCPVIPTLAPCSSAPRIPWSLPILCCWPLPRSRSLLCRPRSVPQRSTAFTLQHYSSGHEVLRRSCTWDGSCIPSQAACQPRRGEILSHGVGYTHTGCYESYTRTHTYTGCCRRRRWMPERSSHSTVLAHLCHVAHPSQHSGVGRLVLFGARNLGLCVLPGLQWAGRGRAGEQGGVLTGLEVRQRRGALARKPPSDRVVDAWL